MANDSKSDSKPFEKKWTAEDHLKLVLAIWQSDNAKLTVHGWKDLDDKIQKVFNGKCNLGGAQMQWKKIRNNFINEHAADKMEEAYANSTPDKGKGKSAAPNTPSSASRKRPAPASGDGEPASADLDASAIKPRKFRTPRKSKAKASRVSNFSGGSCDAQGGGYDTEREQQPDSSDIPVTNAIKSEQADASMYRGMNEDAQVEDPNSGMKMKVEGHGD